MTTAPFPDGAGYVRGRYVPIAEATLPVTDWGFTRSDVVYDVVHVFKGGFFRLADHLDRFERSMASRKTRRDRGDPASLRGTDRPHRRLCRDGRLARTAAGFRIAPAGGLRKSFDRLCAALDQCDPMEGWHRT